MATLPMNEGFGWIAYIVFLIACFVAGRKTGQWLKRRSRSKVETEAESGIEQTEQKE